MLKTMERTTFIGVLATLLTLGFFVLIGMLFFIKIPEENKELIIAAYGTLSAGTAMAWGFYFKSSSEPTEPVAKK